MYARDYALMMGMALRRHGRDVNLGHGHRIRAQRVPNRRFDFLKEDPRETDILMPGTLFGAGSGTWGWSNLLHLYMNRRLKIARWHIHDRLNKTVPFERWENMPLEVLLPLLPDRTWDSSPIYLTHGHPTHIYRVVGSALPPERQERLREIDHVLTEQLGFSLYDEGNLWYKRYELDGFVLHIPETVEAALKVTHAMPVHNTDDFERAIDAQRRFKEILGTVQRMLNFPRQYIEAPYANETPTENIESLQ